MFGYTNTEIIKLQEELAKLKVTAPTLSNDKLEFLLENLANKYKECKKLQNKIVEMTIKHLKSIEKGT